MSFVASSGFQATDEQREMRRFVSEMAMTGRLDPQYLSTSTHQYN